MGDQLNIVPDRFWMRRGTQDDLDQANELLYQGEFCVQLTDADGYRSMRFKIGDERHWRDMLWAGWGLADLSALADGHTMQWDATSRVWRTAPAVTTASIFARISLRV
jgi:hypothetical protein